MNERVLEQGKALIRAMDALETVDHTGAIEGAISCLAAQRSGPQLRIVVPTGSD